MFLPFAVLVFSSPSLLGWTDQRVMDFREGLISPSWTAIFSGIPFGIVAFFSVFIFLFRGRTATFAGLVNRLTSLLSGPWKIILANTGNPRGLAPTELFNLSSDEAEKKNLAQSESETVADLLSKLEALRSRIRANR